MEDCNEIKKEKRNRRTTRGRVKARVVSMKFIKRDCRYFDRHTDCGWWVKIPGCKSVFVYDYPSKADTPLKIAALSLKKAKQIRNELITRKSVDKVCMAESG